MELLAILDDRFYVKNQFNLRCWNYKVFKSNISSVKGYESCTTRGQVENIYMLDLLGKFGLPQVEISGGDITWGSFFTVKFFIKIDEPDYKLYYSSLDVIAYNLCKCVDTSIKEFKLITHFVEGSYLGIIFGTPSNTEAKFVKKRKYDDYVANLHSEFIGLNTRGDVFLRDLKTGNISMVSDETFSSLIDNGYNFKGFNLTDAYNTGYRGRENLQKCYLSGYFSYIGMPKVKPFKLTSDKYADYFYVEFNGTSRLTVDFIRDHKKDFDRFAVNALRCYKYKHNKSMVDLNFLKLERLTLRNDKVLEYVFGYKLIGGS